MSELEIFEFLEKDSENSQRVKNARAGIRNSVDPYDMPDEVFTGRYRLTKELTRELCNELKNFLPKIYKTADLSVEVRVLIALSFYASGSNQKPTGDIAAHSVAQQTVSAVVSQITQCLNLPYFKQKYIKFPSNEQELKANTTRFFDKFGIPGVVGCLGGTHIKIKKPSVNEDHYYCAKKYYSLNVQLICDADMQIIDVNSSHGGASHDAVTWEKNPLNECLENYENKWLLGHSSYPVRKYIMTPIVDADASASKQCYNQVHMKTTSVLVDTIRLLKTRFKCLRLSKVLHYDPQVASSIVNACAVLHNICTKANTPVHNITDEEFESKLQPPIPLPLTPTNESSSWSHSVALSENNESKKMLIDHLWALSKLDNTD